MQRRITLIKFRVFSERINWLQVIEKAVYLFTLPHVVTKIDFS